jgi:general secretion pathway protein C
MQEFLRRNFWVIHLAVIAVGAWLLAAVSTQAAALLFLQPPAEQVDVAASIPRPAPKPVKPESRVSLIATLGDHNLFDADPKIVEVSGDEDDDGSGDASHGGDLDLQVDLLGTLVATPAEWSMATIRVEGTSKLVRIGVRVLDRLDVVEIAARYIVLQEGETRKIVRLWDPRSADRPAVARTGRPMPGPAIASSALPAAAPNDFAKGVNKKGPHDYQIDRNMLEENLQDLTKIGMQARIVPNYEAGKYHGFRLVGVRPDSLYRAIGLQSGDLIKRINGQEIDTPNRAIQLFEELRSSASIALDLERRGKSVTMNYQIK